MDANDRDIDDRPVWDAELAERLLERRLLIGLTYIDESGEFVKQEEFCGRVESADQRGGILLCLEGERAGERCKLPQDTRSVTQASPGEYRLRSTGEMVLDPDFTATFVLNRVRPS